MSGMVAPIACTMLLHIKTYRNDGPANMCVLAFSLQLKSAAQSTYCDRSKQWCRQSKKWVGEELQFSNKQL